MYNKCYFKNCHDGHIIKVGNDLLGYPDNQKDNIELCIYDIRVYNYNNNQLKKKFPNYDTTQYIEPNWYQRDMYSNRMKKCEINTKKICDEKYPDLVDTSSASFTQICMTNNPDLVDKNELDILDIVDIVKYVIDQN